MYKASQSPYSKFSSIPTGIASLDKITGVNGIPLRKITEVSGTWSVGKSTLAMSLIAQAQRDKMPVVLADTEIGFTDDYAVSLGVDIDDLDLIQTRTAEECLDELESWIADNKNGLAVLDSVGGLLPRAEAEKGAEGKTIGGQAKLIATFCRKVVPLLAINNIALFIVNHEFTDLMSGRLMTSGGAKLQYHRSMWIRLKRAQKRIMSGEQQVGEIITAEIRKNKLAATLKQECELTLMFGTGFSKQADLMQEAIDKGVLVKKGQFYFMGDEKVARGQNGLRELFKDEVFAAKIQQLI